jgi:nucleolar protein 56
MNEEKTRLERYVRDLTKELAPNLSSICDELLVARLIAIAGSLEKMARMPASTIQLLGAEKALFRHLKKMGKSPKYGIIYSSSLIQNASKDNKGKIARVLSAKLMQAARIDFYSGRAEPKLRQELDKEIKQVNG